MATTIRVPSLADERATLDWLATMRTEHPVWVDESDLWHVFGHADVRAVLRDTAAFSSDLGGTLAGQPALAGSLLTDPPAHRAHRALVSAAFTPRRIAALEPRIRALAGELLDRAGERFDLVPALADPLPLTVIGDLLGLSPDDRHAVGGWVAAITADGPEPDPFTDPEAMARVMAVFPPFVAHLAGVCAARRTDPGDDLLSDLVRAEVDGHRLDDEAAGNVAMLLFMAGHATTTGLLANTIRTLDDHPRLWDVIAADRGRIPALIEEVLRVRPTLARVQRATTHDVEIGGVAVPARRLVGAWLLSANHDPRVHPEPERVDLDRGVRGGAQLAFGHGVHFCLGAPLARLEARVVLEEILDRHGRLAVERDPTRVDGGLGLQEHTALAVTRLPVRREPRTSGQSQSRQRKIP